MSTTGSVIRWQWRGRPLCAYAAEGAPQDHQEALSLFCRPTRKRRFLHAAMRILAGMGMDGIAADVSDAPDPLLSLDECNQLLDRLRQLYDAQEIQWLITWPAMSSRQRLYVLYRVPAHEVMGVVKIGAGDFNARQLSNEATVLESLAKREHPFIVPTLRFKVEWSGPRAVLAMDGFAPAHRAGSLAEARAAAGVIFDHLRSIPVPKPRLRLTETIWFARQKAMECADEVYEAVFAHGDLGPGNMAWSPDGRVLLYDWENASCEAPAATDRVGFWIALRQRDILNAPSGARDLCRQEFQHLADRDLRLALRFLAAHDNLAARHLLEVWT